MDALVFNVDRHTQNYGLLRSRETGEILSMAPNFDNNMALISRGYASDLSNIANPLIGQFQELLQEKSIQYPVPKLTKRDFGAYRKRNHARRGAPQRLCCPVRLAEL